MINIGYHESIRTFVTDNGGKADFPYFTLGGNSYINGMEIQLHPGNEIVNIHIGNYCSIGYNVKLLIDRNHDYKSVSTSPLLEIKRKLARKGQIIIGHDVWIGNDVTILSGVRIGNGAVLGAGTVVTKDVPPYSIAAGCPAKIIKYRFSKEQIDKLQNIKWWNWTVEEIERNKPFFGDAIDDFIDRFYKETDESFLRQPDNDNTKFILLIPDFNDNYPVWKKILLEYLDKFTSKDDLALILRIEQNDSYDINISAVENICRDRTDSPAIIIEDNVFADDKCLFRNANYFITTRCKKTMQYIDYADEFNVGILSGVDSLVFTEELFK